MNKIKIQEGIGIPYFKQIAQQIIYQIQSGDLKKGDKLPAERKLSEILCVSRGTVRKAYDELKNRRITESKMGGNHYILGLDSDSNYDFRLTRSNEIVDQMFNELEKLQMTTQEMSTLINLKLLERESTSEKIKVALIECRWEILYTFQKQLAHIHHMELSFFLLDEVIESSQVASHAMSCDVVLTTATHYFHLCREVPKLEAKLVEIVITWSQKTVFELASIKENAHVGVLYSSPRTIHLVQSALNYFKIQCRSFSAFNEHNKRCLEEFIFNQTIVIAEPISCIFKDDGKNPLAQKYESRGGKLLKFEHIIDKGSLLIIEQTVSHLLERKKEKV